MSGLLDKLDAAAVALLDAAFPDKSKPQGEPDTEAGPPVTVAEKAKALAIAMTWYKERMEFHPPEKTKGRGEQLRERFQRGQKRSARDRRNSAETEGDALETELGGAIGTDTSSAPN